MATSIQQQATQIAQALVKTLQGMGIKVGQSSVPTTSGVSVPSSPPKPTTTTSTSSFSGGVSQPKPTTTTTGSVSTTPKTSSPQLNVSTSIVDYLKSIGQPSDFTSRKLLAEQYGIKNYVGSAEQNIQLLNLLKSGVKPSQTTSPTGTIQPTAPAIPQTSPSPAPAAPTTPSVQQIQPPSTPEQQPTDLDAQIEQKTMEVLNKFLKPVDYAEVAKQAAQIAQTMNQPLIRAFDELKTTLINQFELAKQDLMRQHQQEREKLVGQWTERGFAPTDPLVQRALQQLGEIQAREINDLENKKASHLADLAYNTMKIEPSTVTQIMNSILTTERSGLTSVIDLLDKISAARERRRQREEEMALKREEMYKPQTTIIEDQTGQYLVYYRINPQTQQMEILNKIKIGGPKKTTDLKDILSNLFMTTQGLTPREQDLRLRIMSLPDARQREGASGAIATFKLGARILEILSSPGGRNLVGPVSGRKNLLLRQIGISNPLFDDFVSNSTIMSGEFIKSLTGVQMSDKERQFYLRSLPTPDKTYEQNVSGIMAIIKKLKDEYELQLGIRLEDYPEVFPFVERNGRLFLRTNQ
jgi:hypothetical protein